MHTFRIVTRARARALIAGLLLAAAGCSRPATSTLAPAHDPVESSRHAPLLRPDQLSVDPAAPQAPLEAMFVRQQEVAPMLEAGNADVVGTAVSIHDGRPVVLALTRRPLGTLPARLGDTPIAEVVVGDVTAQATYCGTSTSREDQCAAGTLGAVVTDGVRNYWLSNWHVFARTNAVVGDPIGVPGRADAGCGTTPVMGTLSRFVPVRFDGSLNTVDCAIARIIPGTVISPIEAAGTNSFLPSATTRAATVGLAVKKVGRTTGFTTGSVLAVNANISVAYTGIGTARFAGVVVFSAMAQPGDSGSLICTRTGNNPVALLFAAGSGTTYGCPIGSVYQAIGAHVAN